MSNIARSPSSSKRLKDTQKSDKTNQDKSLDDVDTKSPKKTPSKKRKSRIIFEDDEFESAAPPTKKSLLISTSDTKITLKPPINSQNESFKSYSKTDSPINAPYQPPEPILIDLEWEKSFDHVQQEDKDDWVESQQNSLLRSDSKKSSPLSKNISSSEHQISSNKLKSSSSQTSASQSSQSQPTPSIASQKTLKQSATTPTSKSKLNSHPTLYQQRLEEEKKKSPESKPQTLSTISHSQPDILLNNSQAIGPTTGLLGNTTRPSAALASNSKTISKSSQSQYPEIISSTPSSIRTKLSQPLAASKQSQKEQESLFARTIETKPFSTTNLTIASEKPSSDLSKTAQNDGRLWSEKYFPKTVSDLALHPTKLANLVENLSLLLRTCQLNHSRPPNTRPIPGPRILILRGPAGSAKTAAIRLLIGKNEINKILPIEKFNCELIEYSTPIQPTIMGLDSSEPYESRLKPFLLQIQNQKFPSLQIDGLEPSQYSKQPHMIGNDPTLIQDKESTQQGHDRRIKVLLVEDLPNLHDWRQKAEFQQSIKNLLYSDQYNPVIFIMSNSNAGNASDPWKIFSGEILDNKAVKMIEFNSVNSTIMKKVLNNIVKEEGLYVNKEDIQTLVETCHGDLRNAITTLQFLVTKGYAPLSSQKPSKKSSTKKAAFQSADKNQQQAASNQNSSSIQNIENNSNDYSRSEVLKKKKSSKNYNQVDEYEKVTVYPALGRDISLSLFHSIGKILHNKRLRNGDVNDAGNQVNELENHQIVPKTSKYYRLPLKASPETIHASNIGYDSSGDIFLYYLHENYPKFYAEMEDLKNAADYLSIADSFTGFYRESSTMGEYADLVAMRGLLYSNAHPKERSYTSLVKPQSLTANRTKRDNCDIVDLIYGSPNMDFDVPSYGYLSSRNGSKSSNEYRTGLGSAYSNNFGATKKPEIEVELLARAELPPQQNHILPRRQVVCDLLPFQGMIVKMANRTSSLKTILKPAEASFVEILCRYSSLAGISRNNFSNHSNTLGEQDEHEDDEEMESTRKEVDRKRTVMENILRDRKSAKTQSLTSPSTHFGHHSGSYFGGNTNMMSQTSVNKFASQQNFGTTNPSTSLVNTSSSQRPVPNTQNTVSTVRHGPFIMRRPNPSPTVAQSSVSNSTQSVVTQNPQVVPSDPSLVQTHSSTKLHTDTIQQPQPVIRGFFQSQRQFPPILGNMTQSDVIDEIEDW